MSLTGACSPHALSGASGPAAARPIAVPLGGSEAGIGITTVVCDVSEGILASTLAAYADQPLPISNELESLWEVHGLRMVSLPVEDAPAVLSKLHTEGGSQSQWLGQAYAWTEIARGSELGAGRVVALDAERIRLAPGALRLLLRSWIEPVPSEPIIGGVSGGAVESGLALPRAALRVELLPQNHEAGRDDPMQSSLAFSEPRIEAEAQGQIFSRLYARMSVPGDRALLILAEHPGVNWRRTAKLSDPDRQAEEGLSGSERPDRVSRTAPPGPLHLGEVQRGQAPSGEGSRHGSTGDPELGQEGGTGPEARGVPTIGEAMLGRSNARQNGRVPASAQRTLILLIPRVPRDFHLLGPSAVPPPRP
jgi:hypothetical protein